MSMPFPKLGSYFLLLASFNFAATEADGPAYFDHNCTINKNFTSNSAYQFNLNTLLSSLSSNAPGTAEFYNTTAGSKNDTVYGLFMCRGDVPHQLCQDCVKDATNRIVSECPYNKEAIIWSDECLVRYSDRSFFSTLDELPTADSTLTCSSVYSRCYILIREIDISGVLNNTLNDAVGEAAKSGPAGTKKFATKEAYISRFTKLYTLVQCTPDLSTRLCIKCLHDVMELIPSDVPDYGRILNPSCNLRFELRYRFYYKDKEPPSYDSRSGVEGEVTIFLFSFFPFYARARVDN